VPPFAIPKIPVTEAAVESEIAPQVGAAFPPESNT
jgi:hypothetical protein